MKSTDSVETIFKPSEVSWAFNQHRREFGTAGFNYNPGTSTLLELRQILKDLGGPDRSRGVYGRTKEKIGRFIKDFDQISPSQIWEEQKEYKNQKIKADTFLWPIFISKNGCKILIGYSLPNMGCLSTTFQICASGIGSTLEWSRTK